MRGGGENSQDVKDRGEDGKDKAGERLGEAF